MTLQYTAASGSGMKIICKITVHNMLQLQKDFSDGNASLN